MSQKTLDNLILLALFLTAVGDLISLFVEIRSQQQASEEEQSKETTKKEIRELHNEIKLLKNQLEQIKK